MVIPVTDLSHPGLQPYARLTEAQLRNRLEPEQGIFIAESPKVIRVALDAGYEPVSLLTEEKHIAGQAADIVARLASLPVYTGSRDLLASLTGYELTRGVLCAMRRPVLPTVERICSGKRRIVLVDNVVNSTNTTKEDIGLMMTGALNIVNKEGKTDGIAADSAFEDQTEEADV